MSDQIISREGMRARGAAAFDKGIGHDAHGMSPGAPAIDDWQLGWRQRRDQVQQERYDRLTRPQVDVCRTAPTPRATPAAEEFSRSLIAMVRP